MKIMIAEDDRAVRDLLSRILEHHNFVVVKAENGTEAVDLALRENPEAILMDLSMPELDGVEATRRIRQDPIGRGIAIIVLTGHATIENLKEAMHAGANDFVVKSDLKMNTLLARLRRAIAARRPVAETLPPLNDPPAPEPPAPASPPPVTRRIEVKLKKVVELRALPFVAAEIAQITSSPNFESSTLAGVVARDPALAAKVLRLANSAFYAQYDRVQSLSHAVSRLGYESVRTMALAVALLNEYRDREGGSGLGRLDLWKHSLATAVLAKELAAARTGEPGELEEIFLAGLLHDIGQAALDDHFHDDYAGIVAAAASAGIPLARMEQAGLGIDHTEVARRLLTQWRLPERLMDPIVLHHTPWEEIEHRVGIDVRRVAIVQAADALAKASRVGFSGDGTIEEIPDSLCRFLGITPETVAPMLERMDAQVQELTQVLLLHGDAEMLRAPQAPGGGPVRILRENVPVLEIVSIFLARMGRTVETGGEAQAGESVLVRGAAEGWVAAQVGALEGKVRRIAVVAPPVPGPDLQALLARAGATLLAVPLSAHRLEEALA